MKRSSIVIAAAIIAGCQATTPQQPQKTTAEDPSRNCFEAIGHNTQLRAIEPKIGALANIKNVSLEHLSRTDTATTEDRPILSLWAAERNRCVDAGADFRKTHQPGEYTGLVETQNEEFVILLSKLYSGSITYGQFNTMRKELAVKNSDRWRHAQASEMQSKTTLQQTMAAERAQSSAAFSNAMLLMQAAQPRPMQPPSFSTHCQSRNVGGTIYTNCQ